MSSRPAVEQRHCFARAGVLLREYGTKSRPRLSASRGVACLTGPPSGQCPGVAASCSDLCPSELTLRGIDDTGPVLVRALVGAHTLDPILVTLVQYRANLVHAELVISRPRLVAAQTGDPPVGPCRSGRSSRRAGRRGPRAGPRGPAARARC